LQPWFAHFPLVLLSSDSLSFRCSMSVSPGSSRLLFSSIFPPPVGSLSDKACVTSSFWACSRNPPVSIALLGLGPLGLREHHPPLFSRIQGVLSAGHLSQTDVEAARHPLFRKPLIQIGSSIFFPASRFLFDSTLMSRRPDCGFLFFSFRASLGGRSPNLIRELLSRFFSFDLFPCNCLLTFFCVLRALLGVLFPLS